MVEKDLIIDISPELMSIATLEDGRLTELHREPRDFTHSLGDIYIGRVKRVVAGLNAAFVDVGFSIDGFMHYADLHPQFLVQQQVFDQLRMGKLEPEKYWPTYQKAVASSQEVLPKEGKISTYLKEGDYVLVQISKESISTKGPRLTTDISIAGRNLIINLFDQKLSVSSKLGREETQRLKSLIRSVNTVGYGVIVRTAAEGKRAETMHKELKKLERQWLQMLARIASSSTNKKHFLCVYQEPSRVLGVLRDTFDKSFRYVWVNDEDFYHEIEGYLDEIDPLREGAVRVQHYTGRVPIFDSKGVTKQIKSSLKRVVNYKKGAYLVIEQTEAMHVIDVNSGTRARKSDEQEDTAVDVNMAAAEEIVRQLKLRDLGGIIIVDFIDMKSKEHRDELYKYMVDLMKTDRSRHEILPLSKFGLMQITRQRVRPAIKIDQDEVCPSCRGEGKISGASILLVEKIEEELKILTETFEAPYINVHVHPYLDAYIKKGLYSVSIRWKFGISKRIHVTPNQSLSLLEYKFYNRDGEELQVHDRAKH